MNAMLFEDVTASCPYCAESISIPIDPGGGHAQEITVDCEVCCKPILVRATWNEDTEEFNVELDRE
ncbi:MAG: CPXCG motif-containing cysteine-rich protein [Bdellovibrionota bacterium]